MSGQHLSLVQMDCAVQSLIMHCQGYAGLNGVVAMQTPLIFAIDQTLEVMKRSVLTQEQPRATLWPWDYEAEIQVRTPPQPSAGGGAGLTT